MTHKTTMPEPFTYVHPHAEKGPLFTTAHMESIAKAVVREALEEAESIVRNNADACSTLDVKAMLHSNADAIRALIPKEPSYLNSPSQQD